jgi:hypothetical protein
LPAIDFSETPVGRALEHFEIVQIATNSAKGFNHFRRVGIVQPVILSLHPTGDPIGAGFKLSLCDVCIVPGKIPIMIICVHLPSELQLPKVRNARGLAAFILAPGYGGDEKRSEDCYDRDNNKEFDQREGSFRLRRRPFR